MSKSLKRVRAALEAAGKDIDIRETDGARTAQMAAVAVGCEVNQIAKSIVFQNADTGEVVLFLTAGGRQVDNKAAEALLGAPLTRADATVVRKQTGFAIGGVSPVGHLSPIQAFMDTRLLDFAEIWSAAGTPNHVFCLSPANLQQISGAITANFSI
ncbi:YbaK/EbsC family protein [Shimia sagamensis]|uniref:Cys-tRNA(Pro) deacylase, prolyl-tRNA editing enzyme YbaK/EbsC n=1 Tax=Shimia sagamensis TaxID=1566352 RepID=A0ABY1P0N1_9RHOB|nr:YbaK/EbsC family protein [Shimia sagamensis]SMP22778.1 Cys-tRNA(Pro) deacylase, prolyl-tRNA editing enzyme YbaK/EbsC [Shimia sagamensis]